MQQAQAGAARVRRAGLDGRLLTDHSRGLAAGRSRNRAQRDERLACDGEVGVRSEPVEVVVAVQQSRAVSSAIAALDPTEPACRATITASRLGLSVTLRSRAGGRLRVRGQD
jgi:hypothetical protein